MKHDDFFVKLYNETYYVILRYVTLKCDNISNVEDIVQNVYMKVYTQLLKKGFDYFKTPIPLLIKLCKNELFYYYNLKNKFNMIFLKNDDKDILETISSKQNVENDYIVHSTIEEIWKIIEKEDLITQKIATLHFLEGLSLKDIASILNLNINTTKTKLYRLIQKLDKLSKGCD